LAWLAIAIAANLLDAVFTLHFTNMGIEEANPIMAWALSVGPAFFFILKFGLFTTAIIFLAKKRPRLLIPVTILYISIVAWHILWLCRIF